MPLNFTASHSSRITKKSPARKPLLKRHSSSSSAIRARSGTGRRLSHGLNGCNNDEDDRLENRGRVKILTVDVDVHNVREAMHYVRSHMFDPLPEAGGFNSTRIAETLNFRARLPPVVPKSHLHALLISPTSTERDISNLIRVGELQRFDVAGRGSGASAIGQNLALTSDIKASLQNSDSIGQDLATKFSSDLERGSFKDALHTHRYSDVDIENLMLGGFLISQSSFSQASRTPINEDTATLTSIASISSAASGSLAAVGGKDAVLNAGGSSRQRLETKLRGDRNFSNFNTSTLQPSLPGTGSFLSLVSAARNHLVTIIRKTRFQEIPVYLLKERWEGGISSDDSASKAKKYRGEFAGVLPARTRKWINFHGISFEWILAECLGANLIEQFETGSVGRAVRLV